MSLAGQALCLRVAVVSSSGSEGDALLSLCIRDFQLQGFPCSAEAPGLRRLGERTTHLLNSPRLRRSWFPRPRPPFCTTHTVSGRSNIIWTISAFLWQQPLKDPYGPLTMSCEPCMDPMAHPIMDYMDRLYLFKDLRLRYAERRPQYEPCPAMEALGKRSSAPPV